MRQDRMTTTTWRARPALLLLSVVFAGAAACSDESTTTSGGTSPSERPSSTAGGATTTAAPPSTAPPTTAAPTTTTTIPPTTTTLDPNDPNTPMEPGFEGPRVAELQAKLVALGYWIGEPDAKYGENTRHAVAAFQKVQGLQRDGIAGPLTMAALATATRPTPRNTGSVTLVEVDLQRQVLFVVQNGTVTHIFDSATGARSTPTPPGNFTVTRQIDALRISELGRLWRPKYFNGGIAIHGGTSVPAYPASHGCVRVTYPAMDYIWAAGLIPIGTTVSVY